MAQVVLVCDAVPPVGEACTSGTWVEVSSLSFSGLTVAEGAAIGAAVWLALAVVWGIRLIGRMINQS